MFTCVGRGVSGYVGVCVDGQTGGFQDEFLALC